MIIHPPELINRNGLAIVHARVELHQHPANFPDQIWYRVPEEFSHLLSLQSDAFLIPCLLAGMYFQEAIEVRGPVSPRLAYNLAEYQHLLSLRFPESLSPVNINYNLLRALPGNPQGVGTTFSGGVDSLFTLWKHLPQNQPIPGHQVTHAVFIKGFDILPSEDPHYQFLLEKFKPAAAEIGVELIPLETNLLSIIHKRLPSPNFYGPIIIGTGQVFGAGFGKFIIPSSWDHKQLQKKAYSSDPLIDPFLSTDTLEVIHHGATHARIDKVEAIADWEIARKVLWVCEIHKFTQDTWNCSRCEKCVRAMIPLYALGKMDKFKSFEKPFNTNQDTLWWVRKYSAERVFSGEIFPFVRKHKPDLLPWLWAGATLGTLRWVIIKILPGFIKKWLRRYGYFVNRNDAEDAYENPEVNRLIKEHNDPSST